jgi:hypothetical protein
MKSVCVWAIGTAALLLTTLSIQADSNIKATVEHIKNEDATTEFKFKTVPVPAKESAARKAKISIVDGVRDENGGEVDKVNDGKLPGNEDDPEQNFFFNAGTEGGRLAIDLGSAIDISQVNTYSWHPDTRGPQVYKLYASDGSGASFMTAPKSGTDPTKAGWTLIATVDTRSKEGQPGGQYGVSIADTKGAALGKYRYLLFDMSRTEADDEFGNTFYSEITVVEKK